MNMNSGYTEFANTLNNIIYSSAPDKIMSDRRSLDDTWTNCFF